MKSGKLKVLFINRMFGIRFGGGENFDFRLSTNLTKAGHDITILTGRPAFAPSTTPKPAGVSVTQLRTPYLRWLMYRFESSPIRPLRWIGYAGRIIDLVIFQIAALFWVLLAGRKFDAIQICGMAELGALLHTLGWRSIVRWPGPPGPVDVFFSRYCYRVIAGGDVYPALSNKLHPDVLRPLEVGVDTSAIQQKSWTSEQTCRNFLFIGRIVPIKNLEFLIRGFHAAADDCPEITLTIIGPADPVYLNKLNALIIELGQSSRIRLPGVKSPAEIARTYENFDCLCLVSTYENFPNVILEAMTAGIPVIGSAVGGIIKQIDNEKSGFLVAPNDLSALSATISRLASTPGLGQGVGRYSRSHMLASRTWANVTADWLALNGDAR